MCPKAGRPRSDNPRSKDIHVRVTEAEKQEISEVCKQKKVTVLDLIKLGMIEANKK